VFCLGLISVHSNVIFFFFFFVEYGCPVRAIYFVFKYSGHPRCYTGKRAPPYLAPLPVLSDISGDEALLNLETISNAFTSSFNHYYRFQQYLSKDGINSSFNPNYHDVFDSGSNHYNDTPDAKNSAQYSLVVNSHEQERPASNQSPDPGVRVPATASAHHGSMHQQHPRPTFALSNRLLTYASSSPVPSHHSHSHIHTSAGSAPSPHLGAHIPLGLGPPTMQAELGHTALKVGGSVLSGMLTLGGMALSTAKNRVASSGSGPVPGVGRETGAGVARFFSRSAPLDSVAGVLGRTEEEGWRERRYLSTSSGVSASPGAASAGVAHTLTGVHTPEGGCWVTVVNLAPLLSRRESRVKELEKIAEFLVSKDKQVAGLWFSSDGCAVVVVPRDGQVAQTYQL
jgi:hypothetical protein